jgi:hypothetical protein
LERFPTNVKAFLVGAGTLLEKPLFVVIAAVFHRIFAVFRTASIRLCFVFVLTVLLIHKNSPLFFTAMSIGKDYLSPLKGRCKST